jgi:glycosyltransferase involved in cell wall biosynthesis
VLDCLEPYRDRYRMFRSLPCYGVDVHIHSHNPCEDEECIAEGLTAAPDRSAKTKWRLVKEITRRFARHQDRLVVHDLFVPRATLFLRRRWTLHSMARVRNVVSFYSPTAEFFLQGHWRKAEGGSLGWRKRLFWYNAMCREIPREWLAVRLADGITANADNILEGARRYYRIGDRKAVVLPTSVDTEFWHPECARRRFSESHAPPVLLFAGTLTPRKGFRFALDVVACLAARYPNVQFRVAGSYTPESNPSEIQHQLRRLGLERHVRFLGHLDRQRLREEYRRATALLHTTLHEGSPRVVKEAAACGCPVITSSIPGTIAIDPEEDFVGYCRAGETEGFVARISRLIEQPCYSESVSRLGRQRMVERFSSSVIAQRMLSFYESLF